MPILAEHPLLTKYRELLSSRGATLLDTQWKGKSHNYRIKCENGHECSPLYVSVVGRSGNTKGKGICKYCAGMDSGVAEAKFRARLIELGAKLLEDQWLGSAIPHRVICKNGHECKPRPSKVNSGQGICRKCAGLEFGISATRFRQRLVELGITLLEDNWLGAIRPHKAICSNGHYCYPIPHHVLAGKGGCKTCAGRDPESAEREFKAKLTELGAEYLESKWLGVDKPHHVRCAAGHDCYPRPNSVQQGHGICWPCGRMIGSRKIAMAAEIRFKELLADQNAVLLSDQWYGAHIPHKVCCIRGHITYTRPSGIQQGKGICRFCKGMIWDVFYVVVNEKNNAVKFGITSGDPKCRLRFHKSAGYSKVVRCYKNIPGMAEDVEANIKEMLNERDFKPLQGKEYFDISALPIIVDYIDQCMGLEPEDIVALIA